MTKNIFTMQSGRSWRDYSKQAALALFTYLKPAALALSTYLKKAALALFIKLTRLSTWLLYEGLNRPFGLCVYALCCIYGWYGTQRAVLFSSQMMAICYVVTLVSLSLILPVLILVPATRTFLHSQIGEELIKKRVGAYGARPLIAAILGPFFLCFLDSYTGQGPSGPDLGHWKEISAHTRGVRDQNLLHLKGELDQLDGEYKSLLEAKEGPRDPHQMEELTRKKESKFYEYLYRLRKINKDAFNMSMQAVKSQEKIGSVTELSDPIKDFFRGNEKNRSLWVIDRGLPGGVGLDQYDQNLNPSSQLDATHLKESEEKVDLPLSPEKEEVGLDSNQKQDGMEKGDPLAKDGGTVHVED